VAEQCAINISSFQNTYYHSGKSSTVSTMWTTALIGSKLNKRIWDLWQNYLSSGLADYTPVKFLQHSLYKDWVKVNLYFLYLDRLQNDKCTLDLVAPCPIILESGPEVWGLLHRKVILSNPTLILTAWNILVRQGKCKQVCHEKPKILSAQADN